MNKTEIKPKKKKRKIITALCILAALVVIIAIWTTFGGFGTGKTVDEDEFTKYVSQIDDMNIPEGTSIVALGEATHGNVEFQELKLDVFKIMVNKYEVRAFALEGDFGGCQQVNNYIKGGEGTAEEAAAAIGFEIYRTQQMENLISWMREYNDKASAGESLSFYGFDMQRGKYSYDGLCSACTNYGINIDKLDKLINKDGWSEEQNWNEKIQVLTTVRDELSNYDGTDVACHEADVLIQNCKLQQSPEDYSTIRDEFMAENVTWILQQEQRLNHGCIFISGHNGHVAKQGSSYTNTGSMLNDKYGNAYYAIGTDFYHTSCNMPSGEKRGNHSFYSHDPLAKTAYKAGYKVAYLDFFKAEKSEAISDTISNNMKMGSLGEGFAWYMKLLPQSYRINQTPKELYDSMIFVDEATPTVIRN